MPLKFLCKGCKCSVEIDVLSLNSQMAAELIQVFCRPLEILAPSLLVALNHKLAAVLHNPDVLVSDWEVFTLYRVVYFHIIYRVGKFFPILWGIPFHFDILLFLFFNYKAKVLDLPFLWSRRCLRVDDTRVDSGGLRNLFKSRLSNRYLFWWCVLELFLAWHSSYTLWIVWANFLEYGREGWRLVHALCPGDSHVDLLLITYAEHGVNGRVWRATGGQILNALLVCIHLFNQWELYVIPNLLEDIMSSHLEVTVRLRDRFLRHVVRRGPLFLIDWGFLILFLWVSCSLAIIFLVMHHY